MPFEFPNTPIAGDTHTEFGVDYVYDGQVWNLGGGGAMTDYVLKAGDTMTGPLHVNSAAANSGLYIGMPDGTTKMSFTPSSGDHTGIIEFWAPNGTTRRGYIGYGSSTWLDIVAEGTTRWKFANDITLNGAKFGSVVASSTTDLSKHIALWGDVFGFNVTSNTLNYNSPHTHCLRISGTDKVNIQGGAIYLNEHTTLAAGKNLTVPGLLVANGGIDADVGNAIFNTASFAGRATFNNGVTLSETLAMQIGAQDTRNIGGGSGNGGIVYRIPLANDHKFFCGSVQEFTIDEGGGNLYGAWIAGFAADSGAPTRDDDGISIRDALIAMMAKIKRLEVEIAALGKP